MTSHDAPDLSSPLDDPHRRVNAQISSDDIAMAKLANLYHWATSDGHCGPDSCKGYDECWMAQDTLDMRGLKVVADAVQRHLNHRMSEGLQQLRRDIRDVHEGKL